MDPNATTRVDRTKGFVGVGDSQACGPLSAVAEHRRSSGRIPHKKRAVPPLTAIPLAVIEGRG